MAECESCGADTARESKAGMLCNKCIVLHYMDDLDDDEAEQVLDTLRQFVEVFY